MGTPFFFNQRQRDRESLEKALACENRVEVLHYAMILMQENSEKTIEIAIREANDDLDARKF